MVGRAPALLGCIVSWAAGIAAGDPQVPRGPARPPGALEAAAAAAEPGALEAEVRKPLQHKASLAFGSAALQGAAGARAHPRGGPVRGSSLLRVAAAATVSPEAADPGPPGPGAVAPGDGHAVWRHYLFSGLVSWAICNALAFIVAHCCYKRRTVPAAPPVKLDPLVTLRHGHFNCLEDSNTCLCACLCPSIRWADTLDQAKLLDFWLAFALMAALALLNYAAYGTYEAGIFTTLALFYFRQELRKKLKLQSWTCPTCCFDFCFVCWCPCCAVAQEATVVKEAIQSGLDGFDMPVVEPPMMEQPMGP